MGLMEEGRKGEEEEEEEGGRLIQIRLPKALHAGISTELCWECPGTLGLLYSLCSDSNLQPGFRDRNSKRCLRTTQRCPHLSYKRKKKKLSSCGWSGSEPPPEGQV